MSHHYFVSNGLGFATADTLDEAIDKLWHARHTNVRTWLLNCHKEGQLGLPFFCCRVPLSADVHYKIEWFAPVVEGLTECQNRILTFYSQKKIAHTASPDDRIRKLEDTIAKASKVLLEEEAADES